MRRPKRRSSSFLIAIAISLITPGHADAECIGLTVRQAQEAAALVFSGTVRSIEWDQGHHWEKIAFNVERVWNGQLHRREVLTFNSLGIDQFAFGRDERYFVFAALSRDPGIEPPAGFNRVFYYASKCGPTQPLAEARDALKELGRGHRPEPR
jgi:hypothetical protein